MKHTVVIDMSNKNALIAMAHVSENVNNPYYVFEEYIKYCIFTSGRDSLSIKDTRNLVKDEFGIYIPQYVFVSCLNDIASEGLIISKDSMISVTGEYDTEPFEKTKLEYQETEKKLVDKLIASVSEYGLNWDFEKAREQLIKVLDCNGLAYEIFIHNKDISEETINDSLELQIESDENDSVDEEDDSQPLYSDTFYVGRFITQLLLSDSLEKQYLIKVCEGLMISIGANQMPSFGSKKSYPQIKGTEFFFDTKLLLRYIGCAGEAAIKASQELVGMIQKAGGRIYYYPHTFSEMDHALEDALLYKQSKIYHLDYEMRLFAQNKSISVISAKKANLASELNKANIYEKPLANYSKSDQIKFGFDYDDWKSFFLKNLHWKDKAVENDARSIWETHMRRSGDYRDYCGTNKHLCVFVTNNSRLIGASLKFKEERPSINSISGWRNNRLPVITDIRLTCRLWSPADQSERLAQLYLTSNAVAAQRPTQRYINGMRSLVEELSKSVPEYESICLSEYFDDNVTEKILEKTHGDASSFTIGALSETLEEITEYKAAQEQERTKQFQEQLEKANESLANTNKRALKQENDIIESAIIANTNTLGFYSKMKLVSAMYSSEIIGSVFAAITMLLSLLLQNACVLLIVFVPIIVYLIERFFTGQAVRRKIINKVLPQVIKVYEKRIKNNLRKVEVPYEKDIVNDAVEKTELIIKCRQRL